MYNFILSTNNNMTVTQSIIFSKEFYDTARARRWLSRHHYVPIKRVHETTRYLRYRIKEPDERYEYRIKPFTNGVKAVIGFVSYQLYE